MSDQERIKKMLDPDPSGFSARYHARVLARKRQKIDWREVLATVKVLKLVAGDIEEDDV